MKISSLSYDNWTCILKKDVKGKFVEIDFFKGYIVLLWYIDMIAGQGIAENGIPYFQDLYLDLIVYPDGTILW